MKEYIVGVREVHVQQVKVKANNPKEAIRKVSEGEGLYLDNKIEYSHTLDPSTWDIEEQECLQLSFFD